MSAPTTIDNILLLCSSHPFLWWDTHVSSNITTVAVDDTTTAVPLYASNSFLALSPSMFLLMLLLRLLLLCWRRLRLHLESRKPFDDLPMPHHSHWLLGHLSLLRTVMFDTGTSAHKFRNELRCHNEHGQLGIWMPVLADRSSRAAIVMSVEDARTVLTTEYYRRTSPIFAKHVKMFLGSKNIGILHGKEWRLHRSIIHRSICPTALNESRASMIVVAESLVASLKAKIKNETLASGSNSTGAIETSIEPLMKMITIDVFAQSALSVNLGCCQSLKLSPIAVAFEFLLNELGDRITNPSLATLSHFYGLPTLRNRRYYQERTVIRSFLGNLIRERKQEQDNPDPEKEPKNDMLGNLLQEHRDVKNSNAGGITSNQAIEDTLMTLLFAGYDTTSITLTCALYCIAMNPQVEELCLEEIHSLPEPPDDQVYSPNDLPYCRAVIYETLRLYPPAPLTSRIMRKDVPLKGGFVIPRGSRVFVPIEIIQHDECNFPRPTEFCPDRWVKCKTRRGDTACGNIDDDKNKSSKWEERTPKDDDYYREDNNEENRGSTGVPAANRSAFFAFSAGGRSCPGQKFAIQETVLVLAVLLRHLQFRPIPGKELVTVRGGIVKHPKDGMPMMVRPR